VIGHISRMSTHLLIILFVSLAMGSCSSNRTVNNEENPAMDVDLDSVSTSEVLVDSVSCDLEIELPIIDLPLSIDYDYFRMADASMNKVLVDGNCLGTGEIELYEGLPVSVNHMIGRIVLQDSISRFLVIVEPNPENPMDLALISANVYSKQGNRFVHEIEVAKYTHYSGIREKHYAVIEKGGIVNQTFEHSGQVDGPRVVFLEGDTIFSLLHIK